MPDAFMTVTTRYRTVLQALLSGTSLLLAPVVHAQSEAPPPATASEPAPETPISAEPAAPTTP
ncbi:porin, partial [Corallococcus praedator]